MHVPHGCTGNESRTKDENLQRVILGYHASIQTKGSMCCQSVTSNKSRLPSGTVVLEDIQRTSSNV